VGLVTEETGPAQIHRDTKTIESSVNTGVEMNDTVQTAQGRVGITFEDATKVQVTEQSKLLIDDFVYDPKHSDAGKLGLKVVMGTARYASGQIAKNNPQNVKIETPTAVIGVRGTDFSMTVDELGRSLIILLPSCPTGWKDIRKDCKTGKIDVTTEGGTVHLDQPFQATATSARELNPTKPSILKLTEAQINNFLILTPPKKRDDEISTSRNKSILDRNALDLDFLKFDELNTDYLEEPLDRLSINFLDQAFLYNILDLLNSGLLDSRLSDENSLLPNFKINKAAGLYYIIDNNSVTLYRNSSNGDYAEVTIDKSANTTFTITQQDGVTVKQIVNQPNGTSIIIKQSQ
jgi:hypothetical protein